MSEWATPKENWLTGNGVSYVDMNRIEGNINYLKGSPVLGQPSVGIGVPYTDDSLSLVSSNFVKNVSLGWNHAHVDVTTQRVIGTNTYTNSTNKPITVNVIVLSAAAGTVSATVGGVIVYGNGVTSSGQNLCIRFEVPTGVSYKINSGSYSLVKWSEFR